MKTTEKQTKTEMLRASRKKSKNDRRCVVCGFRIRGENHVLGSHHKMCAL